MSQPAWTPIVRDWILRRRNSTPELADQFVLFFRQAFQHTRVPQEAWFGAHSSILSLVTGGIFLVAAVSGGRDKGIWLLVDKEMPDVKGALSKPVRSTRLSISPLLWLHVPSLKGVEDILHHPEVWESYARASKKIFDAPISARRDKLQKQRGKKRLSELLR